MLLFILPDSPSHLLNRDGFSLNPVALTDVNAVTATAANVRKGYGYPPVLINPPRLTYLKAASAVRAGILVQGFQEFRSVEDSPKGEVGIVAILIAEDGVLIDFGSLTGRTVYPSGYRVFRADYLAHTITYARLPVGKINDLPPVYLLDGEAV